RDEAECRVVVLTGAGDKAFVAGGGNKQVAPRAPPAQRGGIRGSAQVVGVFLFPPPPNSTIHAVGVVVWVWGRGGGRAAHCSALGTAGPTRSETRHHPGRWRHAAAAAAR